MYTHEMCMSCCTVKIATSKRARVKEYKNETPPLPVHLHAMDFMFAGMLVHRLNGTRHMVLQRCNQYQF